MALQLARCTQVTGPPVDSVQLRVTIFTGFGAIRVEGVEACDGDMTACVMTDADGQATLELPADKQISWTLAKDGFGSILIGDVTDATFVSATRADIATDAWLMSQTDRLMTPYPFPDTGGIVIWTDVPGATFALVGAEGKQPFYGDEAGELSFAFDATTSRGTGGFVEVEVGPGEVGEAQVQIGGTAAGCALNWGWPSDANDTIRVPVRRGFTTYAAVDCN
jgi:hypothetical protein